MERDVRRLINMRSPQSRRNPMPRVQLRAIDGDLKVSEPQSPSVDSPADVLAEQIARFHQDRALFLFERRLIGHAAVFPLLVVAASGVHLVSPLAFGQRKVRVSESGNDFQIDGIVHDGLARTMSENCSALANVIADLPVDDVPLHAWFCLITGSRPRYSFEVAGFPVVSQRKLVRVIGRSGRLDAKLRERVHLGLSRRLDRS